MKEVMRATNTKVSAMVAMLISLISFGLLIAAFVVSLTEAPSETGVSRSFALWVFSVTLAMLSMIFYFIDAVFSILKIFARIHPIFNAILAVLLLGAIPMVLFVGSALGISIYIFYTYYLAIFVLEIVSIVKHVRLNRVSPCNAEETVAAEKNQAV